MRTVLKTRWSQIAAGYEIDSGPSRVIPMEGLRGLAVLLVFFVHYHALFGEHLARGTWLRGASQFLGLIGNNGVDLFFVMSGYLIYGALIRREVSYFKFTRRRIARIYPTFLAVFGVYLVLSALFPQENKIHGNFYSAAIYVVENLLLLPGVFKITAIITVAWSLSFEFFFYLIIPLVIALTRMRNWKSGSRLVASIGLWVVIALAGVLHPAHYFFVMPDHARMISFVAGIVLYELMSAGRLRLRLSRVTELSAIVLVLGALTLFYVLHQPGATLVFPRIPIYFITSFSFLFFSLHTFVFPGVLKRVFSWAPLRYWGNMSYSYYLFHGLTLQGVAKVMHVVTPRFSPPLIIASLFIGLAATLVTSGILFFLVEKRFSLVHKKPAQQPTQTPQPVVVPAAIASAAAAEGGEAC